MPLAASAVNIDDLERLPINGVQIVKSGDKTVLMSSNGRFIFEGVYDTWNDKSIKTIEDVRKYAQRIDISEFSLKLKDLFHYTYGRGDKKVAVFVDPNCTYCARLIEEIKDLESEYTFNILPLGILNRDSQLKVNGLSCLPDEKALSSIMEHDYPEGMHAESGCKQEKQTRTLVTAKILGINAVPYIISPTSLTRRGGFDNAEQLRAFLERQ